MYQAKIIADSISKYTDSRITTMEITFPRYVLAEFNTHRVFSRNSASSRAIPVKKQIERIESDPFIPIHWGKNQSGMQAETELDEDTIEGLTEIWLCAADDAVNYAKRMLSLGLHKQVANRILEPFMWHTVIVTATEWSNFFALRNNDMADPHIHIIAAMMQKLYDESVPNELSPIQWHMPYIDDDDREFYRLEPSKLLDISAARCARVSYLTHDGKRDYDADHSLFARLAGSGHMSPLEHVAMPQQGWHGNFNGWKQYRKFFPNEDDFSKVEK